MWASSLQSTLSLSVCLVVKARRDGSWELAVGLHQHCQVNQGAGRVLVFVVGEGARRVVTARLDYNFPLLRFPKLSFPPFLVRVGWQASFPLPLYRNFLSLLHFGVRAASPHSVPLRHQVKTRVVRGRQVIPFPSCVCVCVCA